MSHRWDSQLSLGFLVVASAAVACSVLWSRSRADRQRKSTRDETDDESEGEVAAPEKEHEVGLSMGTQLSLIAVEEGNCSGEGGLGASGTDAGCCVRPDLELPAAEAAKRATDAAPLPPQQPSLRAAPPAPPWSQWPAAPSWAPPVGRSFGGTGSRREAAMSPSEKRDLDMMFRHQDTRAVPSMSDLGRSKKARQRQRERKEAAEMARTRILEDLPGAVDSESVLLDLLDEEAVPVAQTKAVPPPRTKKPKKRRKKPKAEDEEPAFETAGGDDDIVAEASGTPEADEAAEALRVAMASAEMSADVESNDTQAMAEVESSARLGDDAEEENVTDVARGNAQAEGSSCPWSPESHDQWCECDHGLQAAVPKKAMTPSTDGILSTGVPSTRQGSEADEEVVQGVVNNSANAKFVSAGHSASRILGRRRHQSWADLTDTSEDDAIGARPTALVASLVDCASTSSFIPVQARRAPSVDLGSRQELSQRDLAVSSATHVELSTAMGCERDAGVQGRQVPTQRDEGVSSGANVELSTAMGCEHGAALQGQDDPDTGSSEESIAGEVAAGSAPGPPPSGWVTVRARKRPGNQRSSEP